MSKRSSVAATSLRRSPAFVLMIGLGLSVVMIAAVVQWILFAASPESPLHVYGPVSLTVLIVLTGVAYRSRKSGSLFDLLVAAETIIALGIGCLVISLALALFWISDNPALTQGSLDLSRLRPVIWLFGEGLVSVACATLLGMLLRNLEIVHFGGSARTGADAADAAFEGFASQLDDLRNKITITGDALDGLTKVFKNAADKHHEAAGRIEGALNGLADGIAEENKGLRKEIEKLKTALAANREGVEKSAKQMTDAAAGLATEAERGSSAMNQLVEQTNAFRKSLAEGTRLLDDLAKLIASVESFIEPHRSKT